MNSTLLRNTIEVIDRQHWLDPIADGLRQTVGDAFASGGATGRQLKNLLHGTWLGHPLHPLLTDVALGGWTMAFFFDVLEAISRRKEFRLGGDSSIAIGILGAAGAMASGLADWQHTRGRPSRVGLVHGLLNGGATFLYARSLLYRWQGRRDAGWCLAMLGSAVATAAAYLGGELVYGEHIGVNHAAQRLPQADFLPVLAEAELPEGEPRRVEVAGMGVLLVRRGSRIYALGEACSHLGGPLAKGLIEGDGVVCPWHGSRFALDDGRVLDGPATFPQPCFETRLRDGQIEVRVTPR